MSSIRRDSLRGAGRPPALLTTATLYRRWADFLRSETVFSGDAPVIIVLPTRSPRTRACLHLIAENLLRRGVRVIVRDAEHSFGEPHSSRTRTEQTANLRVL